MRKYGTELLETNYPTSFHRGPDTWMMPFRWQPDGRGNENLIEIGHRNTNNIKIAVENANLCGKNMRYAHFAEICEKCGNMRNMRQSHIRIKLTCLANKVTMETY